MVLFDVRIVIAKLPGRQSRQRHTLIMYRRHEGYALEGVMDVALL